MAGVFQYYLNILRILNRFNYERTVRLATLCSLELPTYEILWLSIIFVTQLFCKIKRYFEKLTAPNNLKRLSSKNLERLQQTW